MHQSHEIMLFQEFNQAQSMPALPIERDTNPHLVVPNINVNAAQPAPMMLPVPICIPIPIPLITPAPSAPQESSLPSPFILSMPPARNSPPHPSPHSSLPEVRNNEQGYSIEDAYVSHPVE